MKQRTHEESLQCLKFFTTPISLQESTDQICIHHLNLNNHESPPSPRSVATRFATNINENYHSQFSEGGEILQPLATGICDRESPQSPRAEDTQYVTNIKYNSIRCSQISDGSEILTTLCNLLLPYFFLNETSFV